MTAPLDARVDELGGSVPDSFEYDAFISYSHSVDGTLAPILQTEVERFAKPWYRLRSRRVFRDDANMAAEPDLWNAIERALSTSRWFLLLASPQAARSPYVEREVDWWLTHRGPERFLVVLTEGRSPWEADAGNVDPALPPTALGRLHGEPRWVDLRWVKQAEHLDPSDPRFREAVADVAAAVDQVPKDSLVGEHLRQRRRTRRVVRTVIAALSVLLVLAIVAGYVAYQQRNLARTQEGIAKEQARLATARALAATSQTLVPTRLDEAQLLATKAYAMDRDAETRAALFHAVTATPQIVRFMPLGVTGTALAAAARSPFAVVGTEDGQVMRWDLRSDQRQLVGHLPGRISSVAVSDDGRTMAASTSDRAVVWRPGAPAYTLPLPAGAAGADVAVSPTGLRVAASAASDASGTTVTVLDAATHAARRRSGADLPPLVTFRDDRKLVIYDYGRWQILDAATLAPLHKGGVGFGVHNHANAISRTGRYTGFSNGSTTIPVYDVDTAREVQSEPDLTGRSPGGEPQALAISPDGRRVVISVSGALYVSDPRPGGATPAMTRLDGNSAVGAIAFGESDDDLVTMSGDRLALWDLGRTDRIGTTYQVKIPFACSACPGPSVAASSDGGVVAVTTFTSPPRLNIVQLGGGRPTEHVIRNGAGFDQPVWDSSAHHVLVPFSDGGGQTYTESGSPTGAPWPAATAAPGRFWGVSGGNDGHLRLLTDGGELVVRSMTDGAVTSTVSASADMAALKGTSAGGAAMSSDGTSAVVGFKDKVQHVLVQTPHGTARWLPGSEAFDVLMVGAHLLVSHDGGSIDVWSEDGSTLERQIPGEEATEALSAASSRTNMLAQLRSDGEVVLRDLAGGAVLGSVPADQVLPIAKTAMTFSGDGTKLISATENAPPLPGEEGEIRVVDLDESSWIRGACATAGRNLTLEEWRRYAGTLDPGDLTCRAALAPAASGPVSQPTAQPSPSPRPSASSSAGTEAATQVADMQSLVRASAAGRGQVGPAVNGLANCDGSVAPAQAVAAVSRGVTNRTDLLRRLPALAVGAVPQGARLKSLLNQVWMTSLSADQAYLAWAQAIAGGARCDPRDPTKQRGDQASAQASAAKRSFASLWNSAVAEPRHLPKVQEQDL